MSIAECIHGLGLAAACTICNGRERRELRDRRTVSRLWGALYPGLCAVCRQEFVANEAIGRNSRDEYVCGDCAVTS